MAPSLSVIIPSHNRGPSLLRLLESLGHCRVDAHVEVVAVLDGCTDGTAEALSGRVWPLEVQILQQPRGGAGAARNAGAAASRGTLLVFLDDDMVVSPGALAAHVEAHARHPGGAVLGGITTSTGQRGYPAWARPQFRRARRMAERNDGRVFHRYLSSGNFSISRELFRATGFREDLPRLEDVELGFRLERRGIALRLEPGAEAVQHSLKDTVELLEDAATQAATVVRLWRTEPEFARFLSPIRRRSRPGWQVSALRFAAAVPASAAVLRVLGGVPAGVPGANVLFSLLRAHAYLRGAGRELRGQRDWEAYLNRPGASRL